MKYLALAVAAADALTEAMKARDEEKQAAITAAKFPVPGQPVPTSTSGALCPTCSEQKAG